MAVIHVLDKHTAELIAAGEVVEPCEPVKKSKKLLCFQVKVGSQTRQIVSGIKAYYKPEDTIGMKVMVLKH